MITPYLEQQILCGNAVAKTFNAGGAQKCVLPISEGRFIVITSITYFSRIPYTQTLGDYSRSAVTQVSIGNTRRLDFFIFRNFAVRNGTTELTPVGSTTIPTYLIHDQSVAFSFTDVNNMQLGAAVPTPVTGVGVKAPLDYGISPQTGVIPVAPYALAGVAPNKFVQNFVGREYRPLITGGYNHEYFGLQYPATGVQYLGAGLNTEQLAIPLMCISYVEIKGIPPTPIAGNN